MGVRLRESTPVSEPGQVVAAQDRRQEDLNDLVFISVITDNINTPPTFPKRGDKYLLSPASLLPSLREWGTYDNTIAIYEGNRWLFLKPIEGMKVFIESQNILREYDGVEWRHVLISQYNVEIKTFNYNILSKECGRIFTNTGALGTVTFTLPPALIPGLQFKFRVDGTNELRISPNSNSEFMRSALTGILGSGGDVLFADKDGSTIYIICDKSLEWSIYAFFGNWKTKTP